VLGSCNPIDKYLSDGKYIMNRFTCIIFGIVLLTACRVEDKISMPVGHLLNVPAMESLGAYELLNTDQISTISDFERVYFEKSKVNTSFRFLLPYDFTEKKIVSPEIAQAGIPVAGTPYFCYVYCCDMTVIPVYINADRHHQIASEPVTRASVREWLRLHILNQGKDPRYSDNPQSAIFQFCFDENQPFSDADAVLFLFVECYEEFLRERSIIEAIDVKTAKIHYPLNILFQQKPPPVPSVPVISEDEIIDIGEMILNMQ
jgi:hypothetical protein